MLSEILFCFVVADFVHRVTPATLVRTLAQLMIMHNVAALKHVINIA